MKRLNFIVFVFLILSFPALMNAQKFTASVNRNSIAVGEQLQVTFSLENSNGSNFKAPPFRGFSVLMGPSTSNYTQIINGKVSSSVSYTYVLRAEQEGTFTIPSAEITAESKKLTSNPISITVSKASAKPQQQQMQSNQGGRDESKSLEEQAEKIIEKNLFIRLSVNKTSVYKGEPVFAHYKLYMNPDLSLLNLSSPKMPVFNGFWSQEFDISKVDFTGTDIINGIRYKTADLKKVLLIPQQTGDLTVDGFNLESRVRLRVQSNRRSRDPFDSFFDDPFFSSNYRDFNYVIKSNSAQVKVKDYPTAAPTNFAGAAGNYKFSVDLEKNKVITNEPVSLKIKIDGKGNIAMIQPIDISLPTDIEKFDPKTNDNYSLTPLGFSGEKIFEYIIIPRNPGKFTIPKLQFTYFDYEKGQFITLESNEQYLEVEKGNYQAATNLNSNKEDVEYIGKDIRFISTKTNLYPSGYSFLYSTNFIVLTAFPIFAFLIFLIYKKKKEDKEKNADFYILKNAGKEAYKNILLAKKASKAGNASDVYQYIYIGLLDYFSKKLSIDKALINKENISRELSEVVKNEYAAEEAHKILQECEIAKYAPQAGAYSSNEIIVKAEELIKAVEGK